MAVRIVTVDSTDPALPAGVIAASIGTSASTLAAGDAPAQAAAAAIAGLLVDVRAYGAVGDGVTDDSGAIQDAIDAASAAGGGVVWFGSGEFYVGNATLTKPVYVSMRGAGPYATILTHDGVAGENIINVTGGRGRITGLRLVGATGGGDGIEIASAVSRLVIEDVNIEFVGGNGVEFVNADFLITLVNVETTSVVGNGFVLTNGATSHNSITFIECYANDSGISGYDIRNAAAVNLLGCAADNGSAAGFLMASARVNFNGCTAEANATVGFNVLGSGRYVFRGCRTGGQLLPWNINGAGTCVIDECESVTTPSGNAVTVSASGTGANRLIGGSFDRPISCNAAGVLIREAIGTGTPESVVVGSVGSVFRRTDGGAGTSIYIKESGTSNTGWIAK